VTQSELERDAPAEAVTDDMRAGKSQRIEQFDHRVREERRIVGRGQRFVGIAEAGQVERDHLKRSG
jgi:hypothetical protein